MNNIELESSKMKRYEEALTKAARRFLSQLSSGNHWVSVTTDYVLDETLTLLRSR